VLLLFALSILLFFRILSLELILNLLQNCGPAFRTGEKFVYAVRSYLCVSLLSNCTSQVAQVTGLALQIFVALLQYFKQHLKGEVEVFVSTIFIRILESENSTHDHKMRVLEVFHNLCRDSTAQIELFINYDCDLEATNLFSRMVSAFAKISKVWTFFFRCQMLLFWLFFLCRIQPFLILVVVYLLTLSAVLLGKRLKWRTCSYEPWDWKD
jgi:Sec7-like guanine-nucleotide exchange factor